MIPKIQHIPHHKSKIYKVTSKKSHSSRALQHYEQHTHFLFFNYFLFFWFSTILFNINNSCIIGLNIMDCFDAPFQIKGFPTIPTAWQWNCGLKDLNVACNKTKRTTFLNRWTRFWISIQSSNGIVNQSSISLVH
jgi:hypothetical protein